MFQFGKPSLGGAVMGSLKRMMGGRPLPPAPPSMYHHVSQLSITANLESKRDMLKKVAHKLQFIDSISGTTWVAEKMFTEFCV